MQAQGKNPGIGMGKLAWILAIVAACGFAAFILKEGTRKPSAKPLHTPLQEKAEGTKQPQGKK
jgi:hypothetical protein